MPINVEQVTIEPVLNHISCTLQDHSLTLVIGHSGSGKSTFLRAIAGLVKLSSGTVTYGEVPLWNKGKVNRRALLQHALAFQSPEHQLFSQTVQGEFDYSLRPYRLETKEKLQRTNAALEQMQLPHSILQNSPFELSGGQKRRVAIATLLSTHPSWLILDEPSAGLDAKSVIRLRAELTEWKRTRSIVMATHDWEFFLPIADRILVMAEGRLLADLTPTELSSTPEILSQAGIGVPESLKVTWELHKLGLHIPMQLFSAEQMAAEIIDQLEGAGEKLAPVTPVVEEKARISSPKRIADLDIAHRPQKRWVYRVEARIKWLMYMVLSIIVLLQYQWYGMIPSIMISLSAVLLLHREHTLQAIRLCKPLLFFVVVAAGFSGLQITIEGSFALGINWDASLLTIRRMLPLLEVTLLSFVFTFSTSTTEMKLGLEKALSVFERFRAPTRLLALAASLVLRFIPMILAEAERFSLITAARGKRVVRKGQIRIRDIHVFIIPLLISLFQMVEDLIMAMEIKGYVDKNK